MMTFKKFLIETETFDMTVIDSDPSLKQQLMTALRTPEGSAQRERFQRRYDATVRKNPNARREQKAHDRVDQRFAQADKRTTGRPGLPGMPSPTFGDRRTGV